MPFRVGIPEVLIICATVAPCLITIGAVVGGIWYLVKRNKAE